MAEVKVTAFWDGEASVWVARSDDVPGLIVEAESMELLVSELQDLIPEMLRENGISMKSNLEFELDAKYTGTAHQLAA